MLVIRYQSLALGRAGRKGEAILFVTPRERNMLRYIERATRQPLELMDLPTVADVNEQRVARFHAERDGLPACDPIEVALALRMRDALGPSDRK